MVKKNTKNSRRSTIAISRSFKSFLKPKYLLPILVMVGVLGYFGFRQYEIRQEKNDLLVKQQKLEELADKIAVVNNPDKRESTQSCRYSSRKFEKGDLSCSVGIRFEYDSRNIDQANLILKSSSDVTGLKINESGDPDSAFSTFGFTDNLPVRDSYYLRVEDPALNCTISYTYGPVKNIQQNLRVSFNCTKFFAKAEHFQVEN